MTVQANTTEPCAPVADVDSALAARALAGEQIAFELLVVKHQRRVAAVVRRLVRDERITEELVQEVFLSAYRGLAGFDQTAGFGAWLSTIARNTAVSYLRSGQSRQDDRPVEVDPDAPQAAGSAVAASPEEEAIARQLFDRIQLEIAALPELQRRALLLREIDGCDYDSIALALGQPLNTIKSHIHRARETIARRIRPLLAPSRSRRW